MPVENGLLNIVDEEGANKEFESEKGKGHRRLYWSNELADQDIL